MSIDMAARFFSLAFAWGLVLATAGCGDDSSEADTGTADATTDSTTGSENHGTGSETSTESTDTCTDEGTDCPPCVGDACVHEVVCISQVRGRIVFDDGTPMKGPVPVCSPQCNIVQSDAYGNFVRSLDTPCKEFDFSVDEAIHITVMYSGGEHANYSASFRPKAQELVEGGVLDVGTLVLYALPDPVAHYTAEAGATVSSEGLSFVLPPGALIEVGYNDQSEPEITQVDQSEIRVFPAPLSSWKAPFVEDVDPELLYQVGPYWAMLKDPVSFEVDAAPYWADGTTVGVYMLGEYLSEWGGNADTIYHGEGGTCTSSGSASEMITVAEFASCGSAAVVGGVLTTPALPRLGWYGFKAL